MAEIDAKAKLAAAAVAAAKPPPDPARARASIQKLAKVAASAGVSIVIHAEHGVGKTSLVKTLPIKNSATGKTQVLFVNIEGGDDVLAPVANDLDSFTLKEDLSNLDDLIALLAILTPEDYKFVTFDSVTNLEERLLDKYKVDRHKEFADLDIYGDLGEKVSEYLRRFADLRWRGVNVLLICATTKSMHGQIGVSMPRLQPKTAQKLLGIVSAVGFMSSDHDKNRTIQWIKDDVTQAKSRYDCLCKDPIENVPKDHKTYLGDVFRRIFHERAEKIKRGIDPEMPPAPQTNIKPKTELAAETQGAKSAPATDGKTAVPTTAGK